MEYTYNFCTYVQNPCAPFSTFATWENTVTNDCMILTDDDYYADNIEVVYQNDSYDHLSLTYGGGSLCQNGDLASITFDIYCDSTNIPSQQITVNDSCHP